MPPRSRPVLALPCGTRVQPYMKSGSLYLKTSYLALSFQARSEKRSSFWGVNKAASTWSCHPGAATSAHSSFWFCRKGWSRWDAPYYHLSSLEPFRLPALYQGSGSLICLSKGKLVCSISHPFVHSSAVNKYKYG
jgi:hypothetical protein